MTDNVQELDCWNRIGILADGTCPRLTEFIHCRNCPVYSSRGRELLDREPPREYVDEWTRLLAGEKESAQAETISVVVIGLHEEWLALKTGLFQKVEVRKKIHRIPHRTNTLLLGLVNIDGELLLCASLAGVLELTTPAEQRADTGAGRMITTEIEGERWVFPVDEVEGIHRITPDQIKPVPVTVAKASSSYSAGLFSLDNKQVALLDEERIFQALRRSLTL